MQRIILTFSLTFIPIMAMTDSTTNAADMVAGQKGDTFQFVWSGLKDNRERLRRGVYHANGCFVDDDPYWGRLDGKVTIFCAFDYDKNLFRFDRMEPERRGKQKIILGPEGLKALPKHDPKKVGDPKEAWTIENSAGIWAVTERESIIWNMAAHTVGIYKPHEKPGSVIKPFDVRTVGLLYWGNLERGTSWKDTFLSYTKPPREVVEERKGFCALAGFIIPPPLFVILSGWIVILSGWMNPRDFRLVGCTSSQDAPPRVRCNGPSQA